MNSTQATGGAKRRVAAQLAAHESWACTTDRAARTAPARAAFRDRFAAQVDPDGLLSDHERAQRAEAARKAFYARLTLASLKARGAA